MSPEVKVVSNKLGVVYRTDFLEKAINEAPEKPENTELKGSLEDYVLVGLLFKEIVNKRFKIEALFFNNKVSDAFNSKEIKKDDSIEYISDFQVESSINNTENNESNSKDNQSKLIESAKVEFWEEETNKFRKNGVAEPFVFFSKQSIELLITGNVKNVSFSGAKIDYGTGVREFSKPDVDGITTYPTLKAESNLGHSNNNEFIPNVILGLPCPPHWSNSGRNIKTDDLPSAITNFISDLKRNYIQYKVKELVRGGHPDESSSDPNIQQIISNWNSFVKSN